MTERMTTWQMEDGSAIPDGHDWVTDLAYFEGDSEPSRLIRKEWVAEQVEAGTFYPLGFLTKCERCGGHGEGTVGEDVRECAACDGNGVVRCEDGWDPDSPHDARTEHHSPEQSTAHRTITDLNQRRNQ